MNDPLGNNSENVEYIPPAIIELKYWATVLYEILEVNKDAVIEKLSDWTVDSESLLQKVAIHTLSTLDLLEGTKPNVPTIKSGILFIDFLSIQTIIRACLESFLVFHYIFLDLAVGDRVKKMRYKLWHASSLSQRQKQKVTTQKTQELLIKEKRKFLKLRRELINSKTFTQKISLAQKDRLMNKRPFDWKPNEGWLGIAKQSPLSKEYWIDIYNDLSSTTHSNAVLANLLQNKSQRDVQEGFSITSVMILNLIIPLFVEGYGLLFSKVKLYIESNPDLQLKIRVAKGVVGGYGQN